MCFLELHSLPRFWLFQAKYGLVARASNWSTKCFLQQKNPLSRHVWILRFCGCWLIFHHYSCRYASLMRFNTASLSTRMASGLSNIVNLKKIWTQYLSIERSVSVAGGISKFIFSVSLIGARVPILIYVCGPNTVWVFCCFVGSLCSIANFFWSETAFWRGLSYWCIKLLHVPMKFLFSERNLAGASFALRYSLQWVIFCCFWGLASSAIKWEWHLPRWFRWQH